MSSVNGSPPLNTDLGAQDLRVPFVICIDKIRYEKPTHLARYEDEKLKVFVAEQTKKYGECVDVKAASALIKSFYLTFGVTPSNWQDFQNQYPVSADLIKKAAFHLADILLKDFYQTYPLIDTEESVEKESPLNTVILFLAVMVSYQHADGNTYALNPGDYFWGGVHIRTNKKKSAQDLFAIIHEDLQFYFSDLNLIFETGEKNNLGLSLAIEQDSPQIFPPMRVDFDGFKLEEQGRNEHFLSVPIRQTTLPLSRTLSVRLLGDNSFTLEVVPESNGWTLSTPDKVIQNETIAAEISFNDGYQTQKQEVMVTILNTVNEAPTISITGPHSVVAQQEIKLKALVSDPNPLDRENLKIKWQILDSEGRVVKNVENVSGSEFFLWRLLCIKKPPIRF